MRGCVIAAHAFENTICQTFLEAKDELATVDIAGILPFSWRAHPKITINITEQRSWKKEVKLTSNVLFEDVEVSHSGQLTGSLEMCPRIPKRLD